MGAENLEEQYGGLLPNKVDNFFPPLYNNDDHIIPQIEDDTLSPSAVTSDSTETSTETPKPTLKPTSTPTSNNNNEPSKEASRRE